MNRLIAIAATFLVSIGFAADPAVPGKGPSDYILETVDGVSVATVRTGRSPTKVIVKVESAADLKRFIASLEKGQQLCWIVGCNIFPYAEMEKNGVERRNKEGAPIFFLPLGKDRIPATEITELCAARGATFKVAWGF